MLKAAEQTENYAVVSHVRFAQAGKKLRLCQQKLYGGLRIRCR